MSDCSSSALKRKARPGKKIYVIGPVTGHKEGNLPAFLEARRLLEAQGYQVDIPHDHIRPGTPWSAAMKVSIGRLMEADEVAMLQGTKESIGANLEREIAMHLGMPCNYLHAYMPQADPWYRRGGFFAPAC